jgi:hypothetical protein
MTHNAKAALLVILALILVAGAAAAAVVALHHTKSHSSGLTPSSSQTNSAAGQDACTIFTLADAKQALSGVVIGGAMAVTGSSKDVQVSGCSYSLSNSTNVSGAAAKTASLIVHRPKTAQGAAGNQRIFNAQQPPSVQPVSGYGDKAFWDGQLGQLNVLKGKVWYVLSYGAAAPADRSLEQTKQLADILAPKL